MREVSIAGVVATCLLALFRNVRLSGRFDRGVDALGGEFVENGDWRGTGGGGRVEDLVSHYWVRDVPPMGECGLQRRKSYSRYKL